MARREPLVFSDALPRFKLRNQESVDNLRNVLGWTDVVRSPRVRPVVHPPEPPATDRKQYIIFYGHAQMGVNFPLSTFLKAVLDFYGVKVNDLTPNSMLMLSTFAYLCEAFVGVPSSVFLWRHFFILQAKGKGAPFDSLSFQRRRNPRT